jgi:hypothetical protein
VPALMEVKAMDSIRGRLAALVGRDVCVSLVDGTRIDDCQLVSFSCRATTAWIFHCGDDVFLPIDAVMDVWDAGRAVRPTRSRAA